MPLLPSTGSSTLSATIALVMMHSFEHYRVGWLLAGTMGQLGNSRSNSSGRGTRPTAVGKLVKARTILLLVLRRFGGLVTHLFRVQQSRVALLGSCQAAAASPDVHCTACAACRHPIACLAICAVHQPAAITVYG